MKYSSPDSERVKLWAAVSLICVICYSFLMYEYADSERKSYLNERSNDILWQQNAALKREWVNMFIVNQLLIEQHLNRPKPKSISNEY